jgi:hypothetical protein
MSVRLREEVHNDVDDAIGYDLCIWVNDWVFVGGSLSAVAV